MGAFSLIVVINLLNRFDMPQGASKFKSKPAGASKSASHKSKKNSERVLKKGQYAIAPKKQKLIEARNLTAQVENMINKKVDGEIMTKAKDEKLHVVKDVALQGKKPQLPNKKK